MLPEQTVQYIQLFANFCLQDTSSRQPGCWGLLKWVCAVCVSLYAAACVMNCPSCSSHLGSARCGLRVWVNKQHGL